MKPEEYETAIKCNVCHEPLHDGDVIWALDNGKITMLDDNAKPFCDRCLPAQLEE